MRSHTKFWSNRLSRFEVYLQTNRHPSYKKKKNSHQFQIWQIHDFDLKIISPCTLRYTANLKTTKLWKWFYKNNCIDTTRRRGRIKVQWCIDTTRRSGRIKVQWCIDTTRRRGRIKVQRCIDTTRRRGRIKVQRCIDTTRRRDRIKVQQCIETTRRRDTIKFSGV